MNIYRSIPIIILVLSIKIVSSQVSDTIFPASFLRDTTHVNKPDSIIFHQWNTLINGWELGWKEEITYHENGFKQVEFNSIWKDGLWEPDHLTDYSYFDNELFDKILYWWDDYEWAWTFLNKYTYTYDSNHHVSQILDANWSYEQANWMNDSLSVFHYNENQQQTAFYVLIWSNYLNEWENLTETLYQYASLDNTRQLFNTWDFDYLVWNAQRLDTLVYNSNHELIEQKQMVMNSFNSEWVNYWKKKYTYTSHGLIQEELLLGWSGIEEEWVETTLISYDYDENWNLTYKTVYYFDWDLMIWNNQYQTINEYSDSNKIINSTYSYWMYADWNPYYHYSYYYPDYIGIDYEAVPLAMQVYPNPAKDVLHLQFRNTGNTEGLFCLFDATGRMVHSQQLLDTDSHYVLTLPELNDGLYVLRATIGNQSITSKVLINK